MSTWSATVFTIFPNAFPGALGVSIIDKARKNNIWDLNIINLKDYPSKLDRIDAKPIGGGAGMILSPHTFEKAFETLSKETQHLKKIYLSPRGRQLNQKDIENLSKENGVILLCGRYEGVDQRILDFYNFEEISIGDFILLGGEAAAMTILEACIRLLPGVVGEKLSIEHDSFSENLLEYNQYTIPKTFKNIEVPEILFSGNHKKVAEYRLLESKNITRKKRPDLWRKYISYFIKKTQQTD